ncbi:MAG: ribosome assembly RNA-binding protein YhbY [Myxococcota bacterium]
MAVSDETRPVAPQRRPPGDLTGKQRRHLRGLAHHLDPVVQVGKEGVSSAVRRQVDRALDDHELIKVRVNEGCPDDRFTVADLLTDPLGAHLAGKAGRVLILYRRHPSKPRIGLPT